MIKIHSSDALLVIDIQNDFCPAGALAVTEGDLIVPLANDLMGLFSNVVLTQDWHPAKHQSFVSQHENATPFSTIQMPYGPQTLWPEHCIQGSAGARFHPQLNVHAGSMIIRKGTRESIDSYSAFFENDRQTSTGLAGYLRELSIQRVFCIGLAFDYCVRYSAEDARGLGFETTVIEDACRAIDLNGSVGATRASFTSLGVNCCHSSSLL